MPAATSRKINRFVVMAMLQAARARHLGLSEESAFSWGLNRAIWYAAAKRGFKGSGGGGEGWAEGGGAKPKPGEEYHLGDELAYRDPSQKEVLFAIGGETQTGDEFQRKIAARFGGERSFRTAWTQAEKIVQEAGQELLRSGKRFYSVVYKPRRDELVAQWTKEFGPST
jgi:hypothetical protein